DAEADVTVKDGRLTLTNGNDAKNNRICFVEITGTADGHDAKPAVSVSASDARASEADANVGTFWFSRTGDTSAALTAKYVVTGSATSGADYKALSGTVTFAAGSPDALVDLTPLADKLIEGDETVTVTLSTSSGSLYD